ncbi:uncharacterized protein LOC132619536 [Lycium barbarum]|uniref:uncharacterized protein LOC132619536 n=1 Tax=Lycium barbarum TaxID=112863 RepID=UPI00293ED9F1|nr:uncharacterized protein LOC132619536 [Lycium barbarum]
MYEYHETHGHRTEDCQQLKEEVARLLKNDQLREFLSERAKNHYKERKNQKRAELVEPQHSIRTIKLTNNEVEYEAMIASSELARSLGDEIIKAKCESLLVVNQVNGVFEVKDERMQGYLEKTQVILHRFKEWTMQHVPREQNNEADALANLGSSIEGEEINPGAIVQLMNSAVENGHAEINTMGLT